MRCGAKGTSQWKISLSVGQDESINSLYIVIVYYIHSFTRKNIQPIMPSTADVEFND